jgi:homopolymeric O-antigen transport system permease protein
MVKCPRRPITHLSFLEEPSRPPLIRINATTSRTLPQLRDAWHHRELLYFLVLRDLKVRYRQTMLGIAWVVLRPVLTAVVFTIFFSRLGHFQSDGVPYQLFDSRRPRRRAVAAAC